MAQRHEYDRMYLGALLLGVVVLAFHLYYYCRPLLGPPSEWTRPFDSLVATLRGGGLFRSPLVTRLPAVALLCVVAAVRSGRGRKVAWWLIAVTALAGLGLCLAPVRSPLGILVATLSGTASLVWSLAMLGRSFAPFQEHGNDLRESFRQEAEPHPGNHSVVLETRYFWKGSWHRGWITVENPFRGTLVVGSAGSGKSFSVFIPFIEQMISKGYTMMLYDFKMPDLSEVVYNALLRYKDRYAKTPQFHCINFREPLKSNRCNPISPEYITDIIDASETARVVMDALNKGNEKKDFFWMSAQQYIGICLWLLREYVPEGGRAGDWCDFPHLIELVNQDYKKVLRLARRQSSLDSKARVFIDALDANAQDQLQGQIASARIPLNDIASPALYWVLSGNDFSLDLNDPEAPKVLCIGNDPDRQQVYGAALSLFTFRVIKRVNSRGKLPCAVVIDELPTISVQGLDGLMATARSNKVAVVLGIQDLAQVKADYGDRVADKILSLPANVFVGASSVTTAEKYSKEFGREFRRQESQTRSLDSDSVNISYHEEDVMPVRKITTLPQGTFVGKVATENGSPIRQPFFCGAIRIDMDEWARRRKESRPLPDLSAFGEKELWERLHVPGVMKTYLVDAMAKGLTAGMVPKGVDPLSHAQALYDRMTDEECDRMLQGLLPEIARSEMESLIRENYDRIRRDVSRMVSVVNDEQDGDDPSLDQGLGLPGPDEQINSVYER